MLEFLRMVVNALEFWRLIYVGRKTTSQCINLIYFFDPRTGHEGPEGQWRYGPTCYLTSALDSGGWFTQRPCHFTPRRRDSVPILQDVGWAPGPVWTGAENFLPTGSRSPDDSVRSESLSWCVTLQGHIRWACSGRVMVKWPSVWWFAIWNDVCFLYFYAIWQRVTDILADIRCLLDVTSEEYTGAGGRAYSVREVTRAGYLFCFVYQSALTIAVQVTRSKPSTWTFCKARN